MNAATNRSFVVIDEVGRGTSTYEGMAIAWAVLEHLMNVLNARCLFATHYRELAKLADKSRLGLCCIEALEGPTGELIYVHKVKPGVAVSSHGLNVAKIAGVPESVVARAAEILPKLEEKNAFQ